MEIRHNSESDMEQLMRCILNDDSAAVGRLLKANKELVTCTFRTPILCREKIFHWIYVGDTALHLAAAGYRVQIVRALLKAGAAPNAAGNHRQSTALHYAADGFLSGPVWNERNQVETIRELVNYGADVQWKDKNGATALHRAVRTRCAAAVKYLIQSGADPRAKNKSGSSAFHLAVQDTGRGGAGAPIARMAQKQIIEYFLSLGISPSLKSDRGKTVRDSARAPWVRDLLASV